MGRKAKQVIDQIKDTAESAQSVVIEQPKKLWVCLELVGTADLIQNNFSQKAVEQMLRKHMGITVTRERKNPRQCIEDAKILNVKETICIPPTWVKNAMLTAATHTKTLKKTQLRTTLFVVGQSIPLQFKDMVPRMDMVRTSGMTRQPDIRFRPAFTDWSVKVLIEFSDALPVQSVVDLVNRAGSGGFGEWRPERNGTFGTFRVVRSISDPKEVAKVRDECSVALKSLVIPPWAMDADIDPVMLGKMFAHAAEAVDEPEEEEEEAPAPKRKPRPEPVVAQVVDTRKNGRRNGVARI